MDPDPDVGADIYWYANDLDTDGIPNAGVQQFALTVPSTTTVNNSYVITGCFGNWGYETQWWNETWPGYVLVDSRAFLCRRNAITASARTVQSDHPGRGPWCVRKDAPIS